jgi:hypothetical protein
MIEIAPLDGTKKSLDREITLTMKNRRGSLAGLVARWEEARSFAGGDRNRPEDCRAPVNQTRNRRSASGWDFWERVQ